MGDTAAKRAVKDPAANRTAALVRLATFWLHRSGIRHQTSAKSLRLSKGCLINHTSDQLLEKLHDRRYHLVGRFLHQPVSGALHYRARYIGCNQLGLIDQECA